jgi:hypothetical protein
MYILAILGLLAESERRVLRSLFCAILLLLSLRIFELASEWGGINGKIKEQAALAALIPERARITAVMYGEDIADDKTDRPLSVSLAYATISRHAIVGNHIAFRGQQPLVYRNAPPRFEFNRSKPVTSYDWAACFQYYDYLWGYKLEPDWKRYLLQHCDSVQSAGNGILLRVRKR